MRKCIKNTLLILLISYMGSLFAEGGIQNERPRRGPPPEALAACNAKIEGDTCNFTGRFNETVVGTCRKGPQGIGELACRPKPPIEAFNACGGKIEGDACSFIGRRNNTVTGACHKGPDRDELLCIPKDRILLPADEMPPEETPSFN